MKLTNAPGKLGYVFPAEWNMHQATWLSWPDNKETWPGGIHTIYDSYLQFIEELSKSEKVCINVADQTMEIAVRRTLADRRLNTDNIRFYYHPTNDAWCRDHGPLFVLDANGMKAIVDFEYNAWGGKYPPYQLDNAIPSKITQALKLAYYRSAMVLEGGSVEFNGSGTVLTTTSCLLNPNRNPGFSKEFLERNLKEIFGVKQVLWLNHGIAGDDTDGHIDNLARFTDAETIVTVVEDDPRDVNFQPLQENLAALREMKQSDGQPFRVVPLPMPGPKYNQGQRLPASYANFYICNRSVLVPIFNDPNDIKAMAILKELFETRNIVGIDSSEIIKGLGGLHCLCMQEPVGAIEQ